MSTDRKKWLTCDLCSTNNVVQLIDFSEGLVYAAKRQIQRVGQGETKAAGLEGHYACWQGDRRWSRTARGRGEVRGGGHVDRRRGGNDDDDDDDDETC